MFENHFKVQNSINYSKFIVVIHNSMWIEYFLNFKTLNFLKRNLHKI